MATAEISSPAGNGQAEGPQPLWGGRRIPIILLSGEVNSGKTLFPLLIDPANRTFGHEPTTKVWDQEGSAEPYYGSLNFEWEDVRASVMDGVHMKVDKPLANDPKWRNILLTKADCNDFPSTSLFRAWYMSLLNTPRGRFRVGSVDTFTPIQEGLIEWLKTHPEAFGRTASQYDKAASMFLWPDVKAVLSHILSIDCRLRFETFCMTVHLKNEWKGGAKTGQRIAEGLDVLDKLATLHLQLDRTPKSKTKSAPRLPSAIVKKQRLVEFSLDEDTADKPIVPPRLPEATPNAIRAYIANPPDFSNLKPDERMPDDAMSEDDRLRMQVVVSENQRAIAEAELARAEQQGRMIAQNATRQAAAVAQADAIAPRVPGNPAQQPVSAARVDELVRLLDAQFGDQDAWAPLVGQWLAEMGVERVSLLTDAQSEGFEAKIWAEVHNRKTATLAAKRAELEANPDPHDARNAPVQEQPAEETVEVAAEQAAVDTVPFDVTPPAGQAQADAGDAITQEQLGECVRLIGIAFPTEIEQVEGLPPLLAALGAERVSKLSQAGAATLIQQLQELAANRPDAKGSVTPEQLERIQKLAQETGWTDYDQQLKWLQARGCQTFRDLSRSQADERIGQLLETQLGFAGGTPGN